MRKVLWSGILASTIALGSASLASAASPELYKAQFAGGQQFSNGGIPGQGGYPTGNEIRRPNLGGGGGGQFQRGGGGGGGPQFQRGNDFRAGGFGGGNRGGYDRGYRRGGYGGAAIGAGVAGLAAGALIGGAIANQGYYGSPGYGYGGYGYDGGYAAPVYSAPAYAAPVYAEDDGVAVAGDQTAYCARRYKSYDPSSGTFLGYDGLRHPCP